MIARLLCLLLGHRWVPFIDVTTSWRERRAREACWRCSAVADPVKHGGRPVVTR